jgi:O-antigen/teichoic acid export membrane protein
MGIALFTMSCVDTFTESGFQVALTQRLGNIERFLGTARTVQALRGVALCLMIWLAAPFIAGFFRSPQSVPVIQSMGVLFLLRGLINPATVYLSRELDFQRIFWWTLLPEIAGAIVGVVLALWWRNVWALVASLLISQIIITVLSFRIVKQRPAFEYNRAAALELSRFGRWVMGSNAIIFALVNGDDALVGRLFGPTAMGLYQMAYRLGNLAATEILGVVNRVALPAYSLLQSDRDALRLAYLQIVQVTALLALPVAGMAICIAPDAVPTVLGPQWTSMVPLLQILAVYGAVRAINTPVGPLYQAVSRPDLNAKVAAGQLALLAILMAITVPLWQTMGVAFSVTAALILSAVAATWIGQYQVNGRMCDWLHALKPGCLITLLVMAMVLLCREALLAIGVPAPARMAAELVLGAAVAGASIHVCGFWRLLGPAGGSRNLHKNYRPEPA